MRRLLPFLIAFLPLIAFAQTSIPVLDQFAATTSPVSGITQRTYGKPLIITGISTGLCLTLDGNHQLTTTTCGSGGGSGFSTTSASYFLSVNQGNAFSTTSANAWGLTKGYLTSNAGDWAGTWQTFSPSHFQVAGSYLTANAIATSSAETTNYLPFYTSTNGTPAQLSGGVSNFQWNPATVTLTATEASTTNISASGTIYSGANKITSSAGIMTFNAGTQFNWTTGAQTLSWDGTNLVDPPSGVGNVGTSGNPWFGFFTTNSTTTTQYITGITSKLLSTDANGLVVGTSTIGNAQLANNSIVVTTAAPLGGAATVPLGGTLALTCVTCITSTGIESTSTNPFMATYFIATSTLLASQFPYASSTAVSATTFFGALSGNASTASALAANGTNCSAGNYPLGVDASGNSEGCTAAGTGTVTSVTATYPILSTGGATPVISTAFSSSTLTASSPLTGSFAQVGSGGSLGIQAASGSQNGYLSSGDWSLLHTATTTFSSPLVYTNSTNAVTCPTCQTAAAILTLGNYASTTGQNISFSTSTQSFNGLTFGQTIGATANALLFTPTVTGTLSNAGLAHSTIVVNSTTLTLGDSADTITAASSTLLSNNNTFSGLDQFSNATSTLLTAGTFWNTGITSALSLFDGNHKETAYAGSSNPCSANQAPTTFSAVGALGGCTSTFLTGNQTVTLTGDVTGSGATSITTAFNLANPHWWTATQNFTNASTSLFTATSTTWLLGATNFGSSQQSSFSASGVLTLGTALSIANGGTGQTTQQAALNALSPSPTRAGDVIYYNGSNWTNLAGNNSGTSCFQENSSGVPSFGSCGGGGSQTPWTSAINGGGFALTDSGTITATNFTATSTTATSNFSGAVAIATTSPTALQVNDAFGTNYLTINTASSSSDIFDVASSTGTILLAVSQAGLVSETNATSTLFTATTGWIGTLNLTNALSIANGGTNQTTFSITNGITAFDGTRFNNFSGYTLTSALLTATNASTTNFTAGSSNIFSVFSTGEITGYDASTSVLGQISPMKYLPVQVSTTTAWTATSTGIYAAHFEAPWTGTVKTLACYTDAGTLTMQLTDSATSIYLTGASTTNNTNGVSLSLTRGDKMTLQGGNPASSPTYVSCTIGATQTP